MHISTRNHGKSSASKRFASARSSTFRNFIAITLSVLVNLSSSLCLLTTCPCEHCLWKVLIRIMVLQFEDPMILPKFNARDWKAVLPWADAWWYTILLWYMPVVQIPTTNATSTASSSRLRLQNLVQRIWKIWRWQTILTTSEYTTKMIYFEFFSPRRSRWWWFRMMIMVVIIIFVISP